MLKPLLACLLAWPPLAASAVEQGPAGHGFAPQPSMSVERAARLLRERIDGRVLSVAPVDGGKRGYKVRMLLDGGRVATIHLDRDGRILEP